MATCRVNVFSYKIALGTVLFTEFFSYIARKFSSYILFKIIHILHDVFRVTESIDICWIKLSQSAHKMTLEHTFRRTVRKICNAAIVTPLFLVFSYYICWRINTWCSPDGYPRVEYIASAIDHLVYEQLSLACVQQLHMQVWYFMLILTVDQDIHDYCYAWTWYELRVRFNTFDSCCHNRTDKSLRE